MAREACLMRARLGAVAVVMVAPCGIGGSVPDGLMAGALAQTEAPAAQCARPDFEGVVNAAAAALRDLAQKNTPKFQAKLHKLKAKRNWSSDEFLKKAEPLVSDETTAGYDQRSKELLARITGGGGQSEAAATVPDCALLASLKTDLKVLV